MHFDSSYFCILRGTCSSTTRPPHQFGEDLVYVNAAIEDALRSHPNGYGNLQYQWRQDATLSDTNRHMLRAVLAALQENDDSRSMVDFNLR